MSRSFKRFFSFILLAIAVFTIAACEPQDSVSNETFKITYVVDGITYKESLAQGGKSITPQLAPEKDGYTFKGWYLDDTFIYSMAFNAGIVENLTLYAKYVPNTAGSNVEFDYDRLLELIEEQELKILNKARKSVVTINIYDNGSIIGGGSGIIYKNENGTYYVLTNEHVTDQANDPGTKYEIIVHNGNRDYKFNTSNVRFVKEDYAYDLAVLTFTSTEAFEVMPFGDVSKLKAGQNVYSIGSPLDFINTVTDGKLSQVGVDAEKFNDNAFTATSILHTATINSGNSGGALINIYGQLIGVNNSSYVDQEVGEGIEEIHFAIRIDSVLEFLNKYNLR